VSHPERIHPDETSPGILAVHLKRYDFARPIARSRDVLDAACGVGYGSAYLAAESAHVTGIDVDADTVAYARSRYSALNVEFHQMDATALTFPDSSFDVVVSFETLEHVADPDAAIREAARVLRVGGAYVASTPCVEETTHTPKNPFHMVEYSPDDFGTLLRSAFREVSLYGQHRLQTRRHRVLRRLDVLGLRRRVQIPGATALTGAAPTTDLTLNDLVIERDALQGASEIIAVCR
jgi:SAM-dependent methyltransferase